MKANLSTKLRVLNSIADSELKELFKSADVAEQLVSEVQYSNGSPVAGEQKNDIKTYINQILGIK